MFKFLKKLFAKKPVVDEHAAEYSIFTESYRSNRMPPPPARRTRSTPRSEYERTRVEQPAQPPIVHDDSSFDLLAAAIILNSLNTTSHQASVQEEYTGSGGSFSGAGASGSWDAPSVPDEAPTRRDSYESSSSSDSGSSYSSSDSSSSSSCGD